jgi:uncharacterized protein (DUF302 family)
MMPSQRWWLKAVGVLLLSAAVIAAILVRPSGRSAEATDSIPGDRTVNTSRFTVEHVHLSADRPFAEVKAAFERQVGVFDPETYRTLAEGGDAKAVRARIEAMAGPSGFMLFRTSDHGALLRLVGQPRSAVQYLLGNPLYAIEMTRYAIGSALYAPLRVLIYEQDGKTHIEYDQPSSLFGQFGDVRVNETAQELDRKLAHLAAEALR